jgi:hypothetical protein
MCVNVLYQRNFKTMSKHKQYNIFQIVNYLNFVKSYEKEIFVNQIRIKNIFKFLKVKKLSEDSKSYF